MCARIPHDSFNLVDMTSMDTIDFLFPALPNEIGLMILNELDFYSLVSAYFVNGLWAKTIDRDEKLREKMFRLPQHLPTDASESSLKTKRQLVEDLWKKLYDDIDMNHAGDDAWKHVRIIPFLKNDEDTCCQYTTPEFARSSHMSHGARMLDNSPLAMIPVRHR